MTSTHVRDCFEAILVISCYLAGSRPSCNPNIPALHILSSQVGMGQSIALNVATLVAGQKPQIERLIVGSWTTTRFRAVSRP